MPEPSDATELNASKRDIIIAVGLCLNTPRPPTVAEVKGVAKNTSKRLEGSAESHFTQLFGDLESEGLITRAPHPDDARTKKIGLTVAGEEILTDLAERSAEAVDQEQ